MVEFWYFNFDVIIVHLNFMLDITPSLFLQFSFSNALMLLYKHSKKKFFKVTKLALK